VHGDFSRTGTVNPERRHHSVTSHLGVEAWTTRGQTVKVPDFFLFF
jgi:hypothetical protein